MTATEAQIKAALQTGLQTLTTYFPNSDQVVVDDWGILDRPRDDAPYAQILSAEDFDLEPAPKRHTGNWEPEIALLVKFGDWDTARAEIATIREAVVTYLFANSGLGLQGVKIERVYAASPFEGVYIRGARPDESVPLFLSQRIGVSVEVF